MKDQLKKYFERYIQFDDREIDFIYSNLQIEKFQKKDYLLQEGETCRKKYFIIKGLVRSFYIDDKGTEKITQFALENWWVTNMESFLKEIPSRSFIETIETTTVFSIEKNTLEQLYKTVPKLERFFRVITENMLIAIQRKNDIYLQMKSKERYLDFIKNLPNFSQRVPQYMIASYLEITPEYLSELRKNV